jgi:hypothetical protein
VGSRRRHPKLLGLDCRLLLRRGADGTAGLRDERVGSCRLRTRSPERKSESGHDENGDRDSCHEDQGEARHGRQL